jgi:SsrA-binding protein
MASYAENSRARFDYEILENLEAGLVLDGQEVKSIRKGSGSIKGTFVKILYGPAFAKASAGKAEAWLIGAVIPPYQPANAPKSYDPTRTRKLLLKKSELKYLIGKSHEQGLTLVPLRLFDKHGFIKLEVGLGRGKKQRDKRESITKRDVKRTLARKVREAR